MPPPAIILEPNDGCLRIARVLRGRGVPVSVLASSRYAYVTRSRGVEGHVLPSIGEAPDAWVERLRELAQRGPAVLIAGNDDATELLMREREAIPDALVSFEAPGRPHLELMNKARLYELARELDIRVPWRRPISSREELEAAAGEVEYPCILKPALAHLKKRVGGPLTTFVKDPDALRQHGAGALEGDLELLATEFVPGGEDRLEGAVTVRAADGSYPVEYGRTKVRQYPLDFGAGTLTRSASVPGTLEINRRLLDSVGYVGVSSLETKCHAGTGELVLIEINVRVVQSFGLGDACGVDASWRLYATLAGLPLPPQPPQRDGVQVISPLFDLMAVRGRLKRRELGLRELLKSYRGTRELAVLDLRDPYPALALTAALLRSRFVRTKST